MVLRFWFTSCSFLNVTFLLTVSITTLYLHCSGCEAESEFEQGENPLLDSEDVQKSIMIQNAVREIYKQVGPLCSKNRNRTRCARTNSPFI